ncbi:CHAP domain-containing protein [Absicoccus porci]|uniref:CHAP domain-containing protein n=1 Tax=Absicoccus porci TaxID=2486576 RepID=UPI00294337EB|nr:CHAP domain-containing protein [Absicoccus porci]
MQKKNIRKFSRLVAVSIPLIIMGATIQHVYAQDVNDPAQEKTTEVVTTEDTTSSPSVDESTVQEPNIIYETHVQDKGWQESVANGNIAGTTGESKRIEAIKINIEGNVSGDVEYQTHIQGIGWQGWKKNNEVSGTTGQSRRLEAIRIRLLGDLANNYNILYQAHVQNYGWLSWTKNGEYCGSQGYGLRLEALRIRLVKISDDANDVDIKSAFISPAIQYQSHIQNIGWQSSKLEGNVAGTTGQSKRMEAIKIQIYDPFLHGDIHYKTHIQNLGWQENWSTDGEIAGTVGKGLRIEAIQIQLLGDISQLYDVYYRVHIRDYGWLDWAKNGAISGSIGDGLAIEAINIRLIKKDSTLSHEGNVVSLDKRVSYDRDGNIITGMCFTNNGRIEYCYQPGKYWHSRTSISGMNGRWINYAIARTGVSLPNCFTYATARISEILGHNQSLDGAYKVPGAGDLWRTHASQFSQSLKPRVGALMIWTRNNGYGHVAVVESVYNNVITWSQSNYGGKLFEYVTANPYNYVSGLHFMGYLWHRELKI